MTSETKKKLLPPARLQGVQYVTIDGDIAGQRIDNFLITLLKTVPKSRIYRILRKGEVRVNKKRAAASYRLAEGDQVRIPPVRLDEKAKAIAPSQTTIDKLLERVLYEDDNLLILNKPAGMSVHGGSTVRIGIVEALRHALPNLKHLELAHRLDADTSGVLILAKRKPVLREIHELLRSGKIKKNYVALTKGKWSKRELQVELPLQKNNLSSGKYMVQVSRLGKEALTIFKPLKLFAAASLMEVALHTGRTHQIRVHAMHQGHPVAGDDRYGDPQFNKLLHQYGLRRMFLHARDIQFVLPSTEQIINVTAPLDADLQKCLEALA